MYVYSYLAEVKIRRKTKHSDPESINFTLVSLGFFLSPLIARVPISNPSLVHEHI